jgi:hypothetical protein
MGDATRRLKFWDNETKEIAPGITLIRCGGHFEGGTVLHWAAGANGRGALLSGDIVHVGMDKKVSFMRSYANEIPLHASSVRNIADVLDPWPFDSIYGGWHERIITIDGKAILAYSVRRYLAAIPGHQEHDASSYRHQSTEIGAAHRQTPPWWVPRHHRR